MATSDLNDCESFLLLSPPPEFSCANCDSVFTEIDGAVNEIHIYSSTNEFEKSIRILDAMVEVFGTRRIKTAQSFGYNLILCSSCAETVSLIYKHYLNLLSLSADTSYVSQLITEPMQNQVERHVVPPSSSTLDVFSVDLDGNESNEQDFQITVQNITEGDGKKETAEKRKRQFRKRLGTRKRQSQKTCVSKRVINPRLFTCHHPSCSYSARFNFKIHEHILSVHDEVKPATCFCGFSYYPQIFKAETHRCSNLLVLNSNAARFSCEVCGGAFRGEKMLWYHIEKVHVSDDIKYTCQRPDCRRNFLTRRQLLFHLELHEERRMHLCSICGRTFKLRSTLMKHLKGHQISPEERARINQDRIEKSKGPIGSYICEICHKMYSRRVYLKEHIRYKHDTSGWKHKCPVCEKPLYSKQRVATHLRTHEPNPVRVPKQKPRRFPTSNPNINKPFECTRCHKRFKYKAFLLTHERADHGIQEKLSESEKLSLHNNDSSEKFVPSRQITEKNSEKTEPEVSKLQETDPVLLPFLPYSAPLAKTSWKCDQCSKTFTSRRALNFHYRVHTGESSMTYRCHDSLCKMEFSKTLDLNKHLQANHSNQDVLLPRRNDNSKQLEPNLKESKPKFQCYICLKFVADKRYLARHIISHSGAHRNRPCPLCNYKTSTRTLLKAHMRSQHKEHIPVEEKNRWTCEVCQSVFAAERNLKEHRLIHTGEIYRFPCTVPRCNLKFRSKMSLQSHLFKMHPETLSLEELERWKCPDCAKTFSCRKNLTEHSRMHKGIHLRYECPTCGIKLRSRRAVESHVLAKHVKKETNQRVDKVRSELERVKKHVPSMKGRKSYSRMGDVTEISLGKFWRCEICHRSFSCLRRGVNKEEHMRTKHPLYCVDEGNGGSVTKLEAGETVTSPDKKYSALESNRSLLLSAPGIDDPNGEPVD